MSLLLLHSKCSRILELGSGRSTITLAEYANLRNAQFTSIETSREWFNKARLELKFLNAPHDPVHLVKLNPASGWYDLDQFRSAIRNATGFDFVFIDGPNELNGNSRGMRDSELATREILACTANADVVIIDDVHRRHVLDTVDRMLVDSRQYEKWFYDYFVHDKYSNSLCLCTKRGSRASMAVPRIQEMLDMRLYRTFDGQNCAKD